MDGYGINSFYFHRSVYEKQSEYCIYAEHLSSIKEMYLFHFQYCLFYWGTFDTVVTDQVT